VSAPNRNVLLMATVEPVNLAKMIPQATRITHKTSPANKTTLVRRKSANVFLSTIKRAFAIPKAARMKMRNTKKNVKVALTPSEAKARAAEDNAEYNKTI